jgi:hypothetical protein
MQEKESARARLSGASPSRGGLRISTPICRTSHRLPRLVADVIGPATREVCAVRVEGLRGEILSPVLEWRAPLDLTAKCGQSDVNHVCREIAVVRECKNR